MLSDNIRIFRKKNNMSQDELAEKLGVSRQSVSLWETGQSQPTIENILALTKIFNISADALLRDTDNSDNLSDPVDNPPEKAPQRKKSKIVIIAICAIALVLIIGAVIGFALLKSNKNSDNKLPDNGNNIYDNTSVSPDSVPEKNDNDTTAEVPQTTQSQENSENIVKDTASNVTESVTNSTANSTANSVPEQNNHDTTAEAPQTTPPPKEFDLFTYCKNFAIEKGNLNGDYSIYQQPATRYGGYDGEYFSISYWADSDMVEFCLHCPLSDTYSINFYLRMRGGYNHKYEYLSSRYYRDSGVSVRDLSGYIDPAVFSAQYPLSWDTYNGDGGIDKQNDFIEESRVGMCDLIRCLKEFVKAENMECSFSDFEFAKF